MEEYFDLNKIIEWFKVKFDCICWIFEKNDDDSDDDYMYQKKLYTDFENDYVDL